MPGNTDSQGASRMASNPSRIMPPQVAVGGFTPRPMKDSEASVRTAVAIHRLPIVMVCENNLYSVLTPLRWRHPDGREIAQLARGHGVATLQGDGNDADVVHALAGEAVEHARGGRGPVFVELATYRWLEHCGPNDDQHLGYRPPGEFAAWQARDPLKLYTQRLRSRGLVSDADLAAMTSAITAEIDDAVTFARSSPFPARQELAEHVYAP